MTLQRSRRRSPKKRSRRSPAYKRRSPKKRSPVKSRRRSLRKSRRRKKVLPKTNRQSVLGEDQVFKTTVGEIVNGSADLESGKYTFIVFNNDDKSVGDLTVLAHSETDTKYGHSSFPQLDDTYNDELAEYKKSLRTSNDIHDKVLFAGNFVWDAKKKDSLVRWDDRSGHYLVNINDKKQYPMELLPRIKLQREQSFIRKIPRRFTRASSL